MSVTIDTDNRLVSLNGGIGDTQGAYYPLEAPDAGVIGLRFAYRPYLDTFGADTISPWTRSVTGSSADHYYNSCTWDPCAAIGLSFDTTFPEVEGPQAFGMKRLKGFIGARTGGLAAGTSTITMSAIVHTTDATKLLGNIGAFGQIGGYIGSTGFGQARCFQTLPTKAASSSYGSLDLLTGLPNWTTDKRNGLFTLPANPTEGAKWTVGIEIRKGVNATVYMTIYYNTNSLAEANLLDVFTTYDDYIPAFRISRTNGASPESECAFYPSGDLVMPGYFMIRYGGPSQKLVVSAIRYQYIYP